MINELTLKTKAFFSLLFSFNWLAIICRGRREVCLKLDVQGEGGRSILKVDGQGGWGSWKLDNFQGRHIYIIPKIITLYWKGMLYFNSFMIEVTITQKPVRWFCRASQWTRFFMIGTSVIQELNHDFSFFANWNITKFCRSIHLDWLLWYIK